MLLLLFALIITDNPSTIDPPQPPNHPEVLRGKCISITDGDTLKILVNNRQTTIRLNAIDAPESGQPFGQRAKQALSDLVYGKTLDVEVTSLDRYGRTVGNVTVDHQSVNERLVRDGWAWHFMKYSKSIQLSAIEAEARESKRGLWADSQAPEAPWDYRARMKRERGGNGGGDEVPPGGGWVHVATTGTRYHSIGCKHLGKSDQVISYEDAIARGMKPCKECGGKPFVKD